MTSDPQHAEDITFQETQLALGLSNLCRNRLYHLGTILNMSKEETIFNPEFAYDLSFYFDRFALLASGAISASHLLCPMKQEIHPGQPRACSPIPAASRSQERSTVGRERGGKPPRDTTQPICCKEILFLEWDMEETVFKCSFYNRRAKC